MDAVSVGRMLDPEQVCSLLAVLPQFQGVRAVHLESVWAKPDRHFNVFYRISDGGRERFASLCLLGQERVDQAVRRIGRRDAGPSGGDAVPAANAGHGILAVAFPHDHRLEHLGVCLQPKVVHGVLGRGSVDRCEFAAYRAGLRCQIRYLAGEQVQAYGKIAVERDPGRRRLVHTALAEATKTLAMRVPASLGVVEDVGLDLVTAVDGGSLYQSLGAGSDAPLISRVVRALAELHERVPGFADRVHGPAGELELVRSWVEWMSKVEPSIEGRLRRSLAILVAEAPTTTPNGFAHRDFHDKQVLLGEANLWLLDVDTACTGDAELDLGNFLAHLFLRGVQWQRALDHSHLETIAVQSYGDRARADVTRWYRRASLLRLACVYQLRPRWRAIVPALLGETLIP